MFIAFMNIYLIANLCEYLWSASYKFSYIYIKNNRNKIARIISYKINCIPDTIVEICIIELIKKLAII